MIIAAVVTAAGYGTRLGSSEPKALVSVGGRSLLAWALERVAPLVTSIVVTAPPTHVRDVTRACEAALADFPSIAFRVVPGALNRQGSVAAALTELFESDLPVPNLVMVHDAARAFMPTSAMRRAIDAVLSGADGAVPVVSVVDTMVTAPLEDGSLGAEVDRDSLRAVQTPQVFNAAALRDSHHHATAHPDHAATDDATLVRRSGYRVVAVDGHPHGLKVTREADLEWAELRAANAQKERDL